LQAAPASTSFVSDCNPEGLGSSGLKYLRSFALLGAGVSGIFSFGTIAYSDEAEEGLHSPNYPWPHKGILSSYDHAS
jgi:ubiquinol-cytochrome c reductase cytochrome c1 subunit